MGVIIGIGVVIGLIVVSAAAVDISRKRHESVHGETDVHFDEAKRSERDVIQAKAKTSRGGFGPSGLGL